MKIFKYLFFGLILILQLSCEEKQIDSLPTVPYGMVQIGLYVTSGDYQAPEKTRGVANENSLYVAGNLPWVFVFKGSGESALFYESRQAVGVGVNNLPFVVLTKQADPVQLLILANAPAMYSNGTANAAFTEQNLSSLLAGKTLSQARELLQTTDVVTTLLPYATGGYLPLTGSTALPQISSTTTSIGSDTDQILLTRVEAKVTINNTAAELSNLAWSIVGARKKSRFFQASPTGESTDNFLPDLADNTTPFYLYENPDAGVTAVILKATYQGEVGYYKLAFKNTTDGSQLPILRNTWYQFNIQEAATVGYATFAEALAGTFSNLNYSVTVSDLTAFDVMDGGDYYLGASNSELLLYGHTDADITIKAVDLTTNATAALVGAGANVVTASAGISLATSRLTLAADAVTPAQTTLLATISPTFTTGTITIRLGELTKTIQVTRASLYGLDAAANPLPLLYHHDGAEYVGATLPVEESGGLETPVDWLALSTDGYTPLREEYSQPAGNYKKLMMMPQENVGDGLNSRTASFYLARKREGRVKVVATQNSYVNSYVTGMTYWGSYNGAFWRWNETGERILELPRINPVGNAPPNGAWTATVLVGQDWITLSSDFSRIDRSQPAENFQITDGSVSVSGTSSGTAANPIRFRIGLTSRHPAGAEAGTVGNAAPRYGLVMLTFANSTLKIPLYIRQGEVPDYIMRNNNPEDAYGTTKVLRTLASKISPYNLTDLSGSVGRVGALAGTKYSFTNYPSQSGYLFQYADTYAWSPQGYTTTDYSTAIATGLWDDNKASWESCPEGYHRPADGPTNVLSSPYVSMNASEWKESLVWTELNGGNYQYFNSPLLSNFTCGFYADGFYDRGNVMNPEGNGAYPESAVAAGTANVALTGVLFHNPNSLASLFLPFAGWRSGGGPLLNVGYLSHYGVSSRTSSSASIYIPYFYFMYYSTGIGADTRYAVPIRCFKD